MKRNLFAAFMALAPTTVLAAENNAGTIHFTGEIIEPSCVIVGDSGTEYTVPLGSFPTSLFATIGKESDLVPVVITLKDCPMSSDGLAQVQLTFTGTTDLTESLSLLDVSKVSTSGTTAATGIGIALSPEGEDSTLIKFDGSDNQVYIPLPSQASTMISTSLNARYKSFAATVTPGPADADLTVNILYR